MLCLLKHFYTTLHRLVLFWFVLSPLKCYTRADCIMHMQYRHAHIYTHTRSQHTNSENAAADDGRHLIIHPTFLLIKFSLFKVFKLCACVCVIDVPACIYICFPFAWIYNIISCRALVCNRNSLAMQLKLTRQENCIIFFCLVQKSIWVFAYKRLFGYFVTRIFIRLFCIF